MVTASGKADENIFRKVLPDTKNRVIIQGFADRSGSEAEESRGSAYGATEAGICEIINKLQPISVGVCEVLR